MLKNDGHPKSYLGENILIFFEDVMAAILNILKKCGVGKIVYVTIFCLYYTFCIAFVSAFSYPTYAIKYLLTAFCPVSAFIFLLLILRGRAFRLIVIGQCVYLLIINIPLIYHTFLNGVPIANEGYFVIFEAFSPDKFFENWGWLKSNFDLVGIFIVIISIVPFILITKKLLCYSGDRINIVFVVIVTAIPLAIGVYKYKSIPELFSKYQQSAIFIHYNRYCSMMDSIKDIKKYTDSISLESSCSYLDRNPLYVIVIGESATKHHWGLYGYIRNTTPMVGKRNNIFLFKNAVSSSSSTLIALTQSLTIQDNNGNKLSLVDFFNKSGFSTELYSNQPEGGRYDTALGYLFNNIQKKYYTAKFGQYAKYDANTVNRAIEAIKNSSGPTVIFIHLLGSHVDFYDRYPEEFSIFASDDIVKDKTYIPRRARKKAAMRINSYDNSIYYTDFLLDKIIDTVEKSGRYSFIAYFSDHGEENFEFRNHYGRGGLNSKIIYDIPMIIWTSTGFLKDNKSLLTPEILNRPIWMGNLLPSLAQLAGIRSKYLNVKDSFFRDDFKKEIRLCDEKNYDFLEGPTKVSPKHQ